MFGFTEAFYNPNMMPGGSMVERPWWSSVSIESFHQCSQIPLVLVEFVLGNCELEKMNNWKIVVEQALRTC